MAKTTAQLDPAQALSLQNLITKNEKQLETIYYSYNDQFDGSHITNEDEFVTFVRNYKIWREQMLRALPVIIAHLEAQRSHYPNFNEEIEKRLTSVSKNNGKNRDDLLNLGNKLQQLLIDLQNHHEIAYNLECEYLNDNLEFYLEIFGTGEEKSKKRTSSKGASTGAESSATSGGRSSSKGAFDIGDKVEVEYDNIPVDELDTKINTLYNIGVAPRSIGKIVEGPFHTQSGNTLWRVRWEICVATPEMEGWVNETKLTKVSGTNFAGAASSKTSEKETATAPSTGATGPFSEGDRVITIRETEVFSTDSKGKLLFDFLEPEHSQGTVKKGPVDTGNGIWYLISSNSGNHGWVNELDLAKANIASTSSASSSFKIGDPVIAIADTVASGINAMVPRGLKGIIVGGPDLKKKWRPWKVKFEGRRFSTWVPESTLARDAGTATSTSSGTSVRTSRLTGSGPELGINFPPVLPKTKPWWKFWKK